MSITDFDSLSASIKQWCARTQDQTFNNQIETFISFAEERIWNGVGDVRDPMYSPALRVKEMSVLTTVTMASSAGTIPDGSLGIRRLSRTGDTIGLEYLAPDAFARRYAVSDTGQPLFYTIEGSQLRVAPAGWAGDLNLLHYAKPAGISSSNPTNDMLTAYPLLYLSASLFEAFSFIRNGDMASSWLAKYRSQASGINRSASKVRHGGGKLKSQPRIAIP